MKLLYQLVPIGTDISTTPVYDVHVLKKNLKFLWISSLRCISHQHTGRLEHNRLERYRLERNGLEHNTSQSACLFV